MGPWGAGASPGGRQPTQQGVLEAGADQGEAGVWGPTRPGGVPSFAGVKVSLCSGALKLCESVYKQQIGHDDPCRRAAS